MSTRNTHGRKLLGIPARRFFTALRALPIGVTRRGGVTRFLSLLGTGVRGRRTLMSGLGGCGEKLLITVFDREVRIDGSGRR